MCQVEARFYHLREREHQGEHYSSWRLRPFREVRSSAYLLGNIRWAQLRAIRGEMALIIGFLTLLLWLGDWHWLGLAISLRLLRP